MKDFGLGFVLGDKASKQKATKPTDIEFIHYLFWEKGISLEEFNRLPIPYIFSIMNSYSYFKEQEAKANKPKGK